MARERRSKRDMTLLKTILGQGSESGIILEDEMGEQSRKERSSYGSRNSESSCLSDSQSYSELQSRSDSQSLASTITKPTKKNRTTMPKSPRRNPVQRQSRDKGQRRSCWTAVQEPIMNRLDEKYQELRELLESQFLEHREQLNREILAQARRDITRFQKAQTGLKDMTPKQATEKQRARRRRLLAEDIAREPFTKSTQTVMTASKKISMSPQETLTTYSSNHNDDIITIDATDEPTDGGSTKHVTFVAPHVSKVGEVRGLKRSSRPRNVKQRDTESQRPKSSRDRQTEHSSIKERTRKVLRESSLDDSTTVSSSSASPSPSRSLDVTADTGGGTYKWSSSADGRIRAWLHEKRELQTRTKQQRRREKRKEKQAAQAAEMAKGERQELSRHAVNSWMRQKSMEARLLQRERRKDKVALSSPKSVTCPSPRVVAANIHPVSSRATPRSDVAPPICARPRPKSAMPQNDKQSAKTYPQRVVTRPQSSKPHLQSMGPHPQSSKHHLQSSNPHLQNVGPNRQSIKPELQNVGPQPQSSKHHQQSVGPHTSRSKPQPQSVEPHPECVCGFADADSSSNVWLAGETKTMSERAVVSDRKIVPAKHVSKSPTRSSKVENAASKTDVEKRLSYEDWLKNKQCDDQKKRKSVTEKQKEDSAAAAAIQNNVLHIEDNVTKAAANSILAKESDCIEVHPTMEAEPKCTMPKKRTRKVKVTSNKNDLAVKMKPQTVEIGKEIQAVKEEKEEESFVREGNEKVAGRAKVTKQKITGIESTAEKPQNRKKPNRRVIKKKASFNNKTVQSTAPGHLTKVAAANSAPPYMVSRRRHIHQVTQRQESWDTFASHIWQQLNEDETRDVEAKDDSEEERPEPQGSDEPDKTSSYLDVSKGHPQMALADIHNATVVKESVNYGEDTDGSTSEDSDDDDELSGISSSEVTPLDGQSLDDAIWPDAATTEPASMSENDPIRIEINQTNDLTVEETIPVVLQDKNLQKENIPDDGDEQELEQSVPRASEENYYIEITQDVTEKANDVREPDFVSNERSDVQTVTQEKTTEFEAKDMNSSAIFLTQNED